MSNKLNTTGRKKICVRSKCIFCKTTQCWYWHDVTIHNMPLLFSTNDPEPELKEHLGHLWEALKDMAAGKTDSLDTNVRDLTFVLDTKEKQ